VVQKKLSPRAERRAFARSAEKISRGRERLAALEAGGSAGRPLVVESASQIEPHAASMACLRCEGPNRLREHAAETIEGERLRVVRMTCGRCGAERTLWFRIGTVLPN
jgi:hypothetical protein